MSAKFRCVPGLIRTVLAIALAYALAVQAIASGVAGGLHAARAQDIAFQALCAPGPDGSGQPGAPDHDASLCCILGCGSFPLAPGPDQALTTAPTRVVVAIVGSRWPADHAIAGIDPRPVGARAPPVLA